LETHCAGNLSIDANQARSRMTLEIYQQSMFLKMLVVVTIASLCV